MGYLVCQAACKAGNSRRGRRACLLPELESFDSVVGSESDSTDLRCHDPLSFCDEVALAAGAVAEAAVPLVPLQPRDQAVVPAPRALRATAVAAAPSSNALLLCKVQSTHRVSEVSGPLQFAGKIRLIFDGIF